MKQALLTALLALTCSTALFAQYTQTGLYEDNNRRPVPGTSTLLDALTVLDKAIGANHGNGYGDYTIRVKGDIDVLPITFLTAEADSDPANRQFGHLYKLVLQHGLKIVGIPDATGKLPTIHLNATGSMFTLESGAGVEMSINNVILVGRSLGHLGVQTMDELALFTIDFPATAAQDNNAPLIYVGANNTFEMLGNAQLTGNWNTTLVEDTGAGSTVWVDGGIFSMAGQRTKIHHNYSGGTAGGIFCGAGGQVFMSGEYAEISENVCDTGGGGITIMEGSFEMSGNHAVISQNQSRFNGGGLMLYSDSAIVRAEMSGTDAVISGNYAQNGGGGVIVHGIAEFTMSGANAAIKGNTAHQHSGGVYTEVVSGNGFSMIAGEISGNIHLYNGEKNLSVVSSTLRPTWPIGTRGWLGSAGYLGAELDERSDGVDEGEFGIAGQDITKAIHAVKLP